MVSKLGIPNELRKPFLISLYLPIMDSMSPKRSRSRKVLFSLILLGVMLLLVVAVAEGGARLLGYRPWNPEPRNTQVKPEGGFFELDEKLGYVMKPGRYTLTLNESLSFTAQHDNAGYRMAGDPGLRQLIRTVPEIWVMGGSFTYGWGVKDREAFPSLMQDDLLRFHVRNFGVGGYGTLQNLYQLQNTLEEGIVPKYVILAYASFHDQRNTCNRYWMKAIAPQSVLEGLSFPWARLDEANTLNYGMAPVEYSPYPGMGASAFIHALEQSRCEAEERQLKSPEVSYQLIKETEQLCAESGITFLLAGIEPDEATQKMLERCKNEGMKTIDISVDRNESGMSLMPADPHPSPAAHRIYADKLVEWINKMEPDSL